MFVSWDNGNRVFDCFTHTSNLRMPTELIIKMSVILDVLSQTISAIDTESKWTKLLFSLVASSILFCFGRV